MNSVLDFFLNERLAAIVWFVGAWILVANLAVYGALYALRGLKMLLLTGHSVCPAGGSHVAIDRRQEIGLEGSWVPFQLVVNGKTAAWVQQWNGCRKCGGIFVELDEIKPLVVASVVSPGPQPISARAAHGRRR